jgi:hypothetical protein
MDILGVCLTDQQCYLFIQCLLSAKHFHPLFLKDFFKVKITVSSFNHYLSLNER